MRYEEYKVIENVGKYVVIENIKSQQFTITKSHLKTGQFSDPFYPSVQGVGYFGVGEYKACLNKRKTKEYSTWKSMINRCYNEDYLKRYPTYLGVLVEDKWHNFQNFAEWCHNQKGFSQKGWHLDKDLLSIGNKIYSEDTCVFVPCKINTLFNKLGSVEYVKGKWYIVSHREAGVKKSRKYSNQEEAFANHVKTKDLEVDSLLQEYGELLDSRVVKFLSERLYWKQVDGNIQFKAISNCYLEKQE